MGPSLREKLCLGPSRYDPCLSCVQKQCVNCVNSLPKGFPGLSLFFVVLGDGDIMYIHILNVGRFKKLFAEII